VAVGVVHHPAVLKELVLACNRAVKMVLEKIDDHPQSDHRLILCQWWRKLRTNRQTAAKVDQLIGNGFFYSRWNTEWHPPSTQQALLSESIAIQDS